MNFQFFICCGSGTWENAGEATWIRTESERIDFRRVLDFHSLPFHFLLNQGMENKMFERRKATFHEYRKLKTTELVGLSHVQL